MKRVGISIAASVLCVTTIFIPKTRTFTGDIMDSQCGLVGGHGILNPLTTAKDCTIDCVRRGGKYVLYDHAVQLAYRLDDQRNPEEFAGDRVEIVGTFDRMSNTIHVLFIHSIGREGQTGSAVAWAF